MSNWSDEETDQPLLADHRNYYKMEKWSRDGQRIVEIVFAGSSLDKARVIFARPHGTERRWRLDAAGCRDLVPRDPR